MTDPVADRYARTEPLFPDWAAPIYLWVSVAASVVYLGLDMTTVSMPGLALTKALGIILLGVYALLKRAPVLALALLLSAGGDYALAMRPPQLEAGIGFFGAAHLTYIAIFALMVRSSGFKREGLVLAGGLFVFGVAMWLWINGGMGALIVPASVYLGIILLMAMSAGLVKGPNLIVIGALMFVVSDSLIATRWFRDVLVFDAGLDWGGVLVWVTYYGAQLCLTLGIVRAKAMQAITGEKAEPAA
ncbi:lysoplasmalogenase [Oceanicaulis sp. LC35]|uniref:lysoplasmalogenase n=1 Tax=Oceanicaulis sp. LC35 TaxID=3349635 RepID=UPI003F86DCC8